MFGVAKLIDCWVTTEMDIAEDCKVHDSRMMNGRGLCVQQRRTLLSLFAVMQLPRLPDEVLDTASVVADTMVSLS